MHIVDRSRNEVTELRVQLAQTMHLLEQEMDTTSAQHARLEMERKALTAQIKEKDKIIARTEKELDESESLSLKMSEEMVEMSKELVTDQAVSSKQIKKLKVSRIDSTTDNANLSASPAKPRASRAVTR